LDLEPNSVELSESSLTATSFFDLVVFLLGLMLIFHLNAVFLEPKSMFGYHYSSMMEMILSLISVLRIAFEDSSNVVYSPSF
jgi:hypothetical protein